MEHFRPQGPSPEVSKKSAIWRKFEKYRKVAALSTLLSLLGTNSAHGQEKGEQKDSKAEIAQLIEKAAGHLRNVVVAIKEKGQAGSMNQTPIRRWAPLDRDINAIVGYSADESRARWVIQEGDKASMRFFDDGANGSVDRVIINKENPALGARQKAAFNDLKTFESMQTLADEADMTASLQSENVKVYEIRLENGGYVIRAVDFQSGEASELSGPEAEALVSKVQGNYTSSMEDLDHQITK